MKKEERIAKARKIGAERAPERAKERAAEAEARAKRIPKLGSESIRSEARALSGDDDIEAMAEEISSF